MTAIINALTVDVEDYFQVSAFEKIICRKDWDRYDCRVVENTRRILELLGRHDVRATFFVLGWIAQRFPQLICEIHAAGHEIGSHGHWHRLIYQETPEEFREDLRRSRGILEDIIGESVIAYRAASFSITAQSLWALDILVEEGFQVDSSVYPVHHDRYGMPGAEPRLHRLETPAGSLWEFPPSVARLAGMNIPVGGGGYFRLYPLSWTVFCLKRINRIERQPFMFYFHPWEIDPKQPRIRTASRVSRFRHYVNLGINERKLDKLLKVFRFGRIRDVIDLRTSQEKQMPAKSMRGPLEPKLAKCH
jgi:polysaccharide deacetylase family protein (PEP-CTERM system associated)